MFNRIYIEITNICNLNCSFCKEDRRKKQSLSLEQFNHILSKIKGYTNHIYLHIKGEPLIHKDIDKFIDLANNLNFNINITTNGRLIKDNIDTLNKVRQVNISLHSYDNLEDIKELFKTIESITTKISLRVWNNNKNIINLLEDYYKININNKRTTIKNNLFIDIDKQFTWPDINLSVISDIGTCYGLRRQLGILVDGTVVPCCLDQDGVINLGNIFDSDLNTIIESDISKDIVYNFRNNKLKEELCKRCGYIDRFKK